MFHLKLKIRFHLTSSHRIFFKNLIVAQRSRNSSAFCEIQNFYRVRKSETIPCPQPDVSSPIHHNMSLLISILILSSHLHLDFLANSAVQGFRQKYLV